VKPTIFQNEFAMVEVQRDESANGVRLSIRNVQTGDTVYLDPLELEALTHAGHGHFARLLDPS
jgi:hypothetical protein